MLKIQLVIITIFFVPLLSSAQRNPDYYLGIFGGSTIYNGDLPRKSSPACGLQLINDDDNSHFSFRAQLSFGSFKNQVKNDAGQIFVKFHSSFLETSLLPEYNFYLLEEHNLSPYITTGIGFASYFNKYGYYLGHETSITNHTFNIPFGIGLKYNCNEDIRLRVEYLQRVTFSNKIDGIAFSHGYDYWGQATIGINIRLHRPSPSCNSWKKKI